MQKTGIFSGGSQGAAANKLCVGFIMRTSFFILTSVALTAQALVAAPGYGQGNEQKLISLQFKDAPIAKVFSAIEEKADVVIAYENTVELKNSRVTISVKNTKVADILDMLLKDKSLKWNIRENVIRVEAKASLQEKTSSPVGITDLPVSATINSIDVKGRVVNEKGEPVVATVQVKGDRTKGVSTDANGYFEIKGIDENATLVITGVNIETFEIKVNGRTDLVLLSAKVKIAEGEEVQVVSTGYQNIPRERVTGSFVTIDNNLFNRRVSTDVLSRLDGIASGVFFNGNVASSNSVNAVTKLGINIRGQSTLQTSLVSADPLIVIDNFIYEGNINNINPNDVENITILKDAAAASIWGARAGNGVIVITTKKGKPNQPLKVAFNSNFTVGNKPDLSYDTKFMDASGYIDVELLLYGRGLFNSDLLNVTNRPPLSPVIEILASRKAGQITPADSAAQIDALRKVDVRNDFEKYVYQKSFLQQYAVNLTGGGNNISYKLAIGYDKNRENLVRNSYDRLTLNSVNTYTPVENLELTGGVTYSESNTVLNNQNGYGAVNVGAGRYGALYPYAQLKNGNGNNAPIVKDYRYGYIDTIQNMGFLNWRYSPLDEIGLADNTAKTKDLLLRLSAVYKFFSFLSGELRFQNEKQRVSGRNYQQQETYYVRNLINRFSQRNVATGTFTYPVPLGGILNLSESNLNSNTLRAQVNYNQVLKAKHAVNAIAGAEIRELTVDGFSRTSYGYDDKYGTSVNSLNYEMSYKVNPGGNQRIPSPDGSVTGITLRYISYYANLAYSYNSRYSLTASARKDGSNIFGVKTNDRIVPLWSSGFRWNINKEGFYHINWLPSLKLRLTYGTNGNVYNGSAYLIASYNTSGLTGAQYAGIASPPNPLLQWEKIELFNTGIDFGLKNNILTGTVDWFIKKGVNLIEDAPLAPSTGFSSFKGNKAGTKTTGVEISLNSKNIDGKIKWYSSLLFNYLNDKVTHLDLAFTSTSIQSAGGVLLQGKPLSGIFAYKWAGLDAVNGDPQGFLNGTISKNYSGIINNFNPDSLAFIGSTIPTIFGSLRNTFSYKGFSFSLNINFKLGYYFRRPSVNLNYQNVIASGAHSDYQKRWQKPGDEGLTNIPSLVYPNNIARNTFFQFSETLVEKSDHIRFQDIQLSYELTKKDFKLPLESLQFYMYANNIGILWRANKLGLDPDAYSAAFVSPKSVSVGIRAIF